MSDLVTRYPEGFNPPPLFNDEAEVSYMIQAFTAEDGELVYQGTTAREEILYEHIGKIERHELDKAHYFALTAEIDGREVYQKESASLEIIELSIPQAQDEVDASLVGDGLYGPYYDSYEPYDLD